SRICPVGAKVPAANWSEIGTGWMMKRVSSRAYSAVAYACQSRLIWKRAEPKKFHSLSLGICSTPGVFDGSYQQRGPRSVTSTALLNVLSQAGELMLPMPPV